MSCLQTAQNSMLTLIILLKWYAGSRYKFLAKEFQLSCYCFVTITYHDTITGIINTRSIQHTTRLFETFTDLYSKSANDLNLKCAILNFNNIRQNLIDNAMDMKNWYVISANNLKTLPCFLRSQQSVNAAVHLWVDINKEDFSFLMTSHLNSDPIENFFSVFRMHGGSYNRNPSAKADFQFKKMLLNLKNNYHKNSYIKFKK